MNHKQLEKIEFIRCRGIEKYSIVDSKGNIIMKFRCKDAARHYMNEIRKNYYEKLSVVPIQLNTKTVTTTIKKKDL